MGYGLVGSEWWVGVCWLVVVWSWWVKAGSDGQWMVGGGWCVMGKGGWVGGGV